MLSFYILMTILSAVIIQTAVMSHVLPFRFQPDLLLILAVHFGLSLGQITGSLAGFTAGLIQDMLSGGLLGINSLSKGFIGFFCGYVRDQLAGKNIVSQFFLLFIFTLGDGLFTQFVSYIAFKNSLPFNYLFTTLFWLALSNSAVGCFSIHLLSHYEEQGRAKRQNKISRSLNYRRFREHGDKKIYP